MDRDRLPRTPVTPILGLVMVAVYIIDPPITPVTYTVLAPWMHAGWSHISQNLLVFMVLGLWVENRMGRVTYLLGAVMLPYLALYLPVAAGYGGLSRGASGLTMVLTGYALPVLFLLLNEYIESFEFKVRESVFTIGLLLTISYLIVDSWVTIQRFFGFAPQPDGVSVASHFTGLVLGVLWFGWRIWRHGIWNA